ncbi:MAG: cation:proton antiporter [Endomicrobium sp.]|jgi:Kef-type K+ transport system membrane component KefB|nr:cation:proton antiporter [Endomicrobium sp.]
MHTTIFDFLFILFSIFIFSKFFGEIAIKLGQPEIIGELIAGIVLGPSILGIVYETQVLSVFSELGIIILLFKVGLSVKLNEFFKSSGFAIIVAIVGVIVPYILGYFLFLLLGFSNQCSIFSGAMLTATSIGITARIFEDVGCINMEEAKIALGAAIIDDIIGVIILTLVVSGLINNQTIKFISIVEILGYIILFISLSIILGLLILPVLFKFILNTKQHSDVSNLGIALCFVCSALAIKCKLTPIIGAFIIGIVLSNMNHTIKLKNKVEALYEFFGPIFFVLMGTKINLGIFNPFIVENLNRILMIIIIFIISIIGKIISGFVVMKKKLNQMLIGISMIPRGEVGLIFAQIGVNNNILNIEKYSIFSTVIMLTTLITPILLKSCLSKINKS